MSSVAATYVIGIVHQVLRIRIMPLTTMMMSQHTRCGCSRALGSSWQRTATANITDGIITATRHARDTRVNDGWHGTPYLLSTLVEVWHLPDHDNNTVMHWAAARGRLTRSVDLPLVLRAEEMVDSNRD